MKQKTDGLKRAGSILLAAVCISMSVFAVAPQQAMAAEQTVDMSKWAPYMGQGEEGSSWIGASVAGALTADYPARLQDDYIGAVTRDYVSGLTIKEGKTGAGAMPECTDIMNERSLAMLKDKSLTGHEAELAQNFYELATDWQARNAAGVSALQQEVKKIEQLASIDEVTSYLLDAENPYNIEPLCGIGVGNSMIHPGTNTVVIASLELALGDSAEYTNRTENGKKDAKMFEDRVRYMLSRLGYTEAEIADRIAKRYSFETKAAAHMITLEESYADDIYDRILNEYTLDQIQKEEGAYPLAEVLKAFGYDKATTFTVYEPDALHDMGTNLYRQENLEEIKSYLMLAMARNFMSSMDREAYDKYMSTRAERYGIAGKISEEEVGLNYVNGSLSGVLDNLYVHQYCSEEEKQKVIKLIEDIIAEYHVMITNEDWMSEETKQKAIKKLDHMSYRACYPDELLNYDDLSFASKAQGGSFAAARFAIRDYFRKKDIEKINQPVNPNEWGMSLREANAYYDFSDNSINILSGQTVGQFRLDASYEQLLAAVGASTIGHEISHSFDTNGAQFDENGNYVNWWTDADYKAFTERADRLAAYFDKITPFDGCEAVNGSMVKTEAIADMGGLKVALMIAKKTPNFNYDEFFRQFAMSWADIYPKEILISNNHSDPHPMDYLRINTSVNQFQEFYDTYGVQEGDGMYLAPEKRVSVW